VLGEREVSDCVVVAVTGK